MKILVKTFRFF